jgi:hypothetical protein
MTTKPVTMERKITENEKNPSRETLEEIMANVTHGHPFENVCFYLWEEKEEEIEIRVETMGRTATPGGFEIRGTTDRFLSRQETGMLVILVYWPEMAEGTLAITFFPHR